MSPVQIAREWWAGTPLQRITMVSGAITTSIAALFAVMHFGEIAEPYWIAQNYYVRELVQAVEKSSDKRLLSTEIGIKQLAHDGTQSHIDRLEYELRKFPDAPDSLKQLLNEQIRKYRDQLKTIDLELEDLNRRQSGRRP